MSMVKDPHNCFQGDVALTVGLVPHRIVPKLRHLHWLLKMNNQFNWHNLGTMLCGTDPTVSATAPCILNDAICGKV